MKNCVKLGRSFRPHGPDESDEATQAWLTLSRRGDLTWDDLLHKHRVVLLAEAGSGKSTELLATVEDLRRDGRRAFLATMQDVARDPLEDALIVGDPAELEAWRASGDAAWVFLDAVDEAKLVGEDLARALRRVSRSLGAAATRAHIVISSRYTDWEFRRDLEILERHLPIQRTSAPAVDPDWRQALVQTLRREEAPELPAPERPLVVIMTGLSDSQVRAFVQAKGVPDVVAFMEGLSGQGLELLARRPLDLEWMADHWLRNGRFGNLREMLETSLRTRLREVQSARQRREPIAEIGLWSGLERLGAALILGHLETIAVPDPQGPADPNSLKLEEALPDWRPEERLSPLSRAVFDPETFGRARLHNDNRGEVRSFLAARWIMRLQAVNCSGQEVRRLLFAERYGEHVVRPTLRQAAAWLAATDPDVARELIAREPVVLLEEGDAASLPAEIRRDALVALVERLNNRESIGWIRNSCLSRFAQADVDETILDLWPEAGPAARRLLLQMIWAGHLDRCLSLALEVALGGLEDEAAGDVAWRAVAALAGHDDKCRLAERIRNEADNLPTAIVWNAVDDLFPALLSVEDLLVILRSHRPRREQPVLGFRYLGADLVGRLQPGSIEPLLRGLLDLLVSTDDVEADDDARELGREYRPAVAAAADRLLEAVPPDEAPLIAVEAVLWLNRFRDHGFASDERAADPTARLQITWQRRRIYFRAAADFGDADRAGGLTALEYPPQLDFAGWRSALKAQDVDWLLAEAGQEARESRRRLALHTALAVWRESGEDPRLLDRIRGIARSDAVLRDAGEKWLTPRQPTQEEIDREVRRAAQRAQQEADREAREAGWIEFAESLRRDPDQLRRLPAPSADSMHHDFINLYNLLKYCGGRGGGPPTGGSRSPEWSSTFEQRPRRSRRHPSTRPSQ